MAVELAVGYVSIIPETSKIAPTLAKALGKADSQFADAGRSSGNAFTGALANVLSTAGGFLLAKGIGAVGETIGTAISKGITRYTQIENAQKKLSALGNSASDIARIMEGANKAVKGTAFGMGEAADVAAAAVASGIKPGTQLDGVLRTIANSAAIAGMDMKSMGAIFNKAAASGKVQGDILAQLGDNGVPAVQWLAKELGVTAAQVYKMGEEGKITFAQFESAMRHGMDPNAAVMMGDTLSGMWQNSQAALGRLGAKVMDTFGPMMKESLANGIQRIDALTGAIGPAMQKVQELAGPVWSYLKGVASDTWDQIMMTAGPALDGVKDKIAGLFDGVGKVDWLGSIKGQLDQLPRYVGMVQEIWQFGDSGRAPAWLEALVNGFRDLWDRGVALSKSLWDLGVALAPIAVDAGKVVAIIGGGLALAAWETFKAILDVITPLISGLASVISEHKTAVEILGVTILGLVGAYRAVQMGIAAYNGVIAAAKGVQMGFAAASYGSAAATYAVTGAQKLGLLAGNIYNNALKVWTITTKVASAAMKGLGWAVRFATGPIGLIITGITLLVGALIYAYNHNETFRNAVNKAWAAIRTAIGVVVDWVRNTVLPGLAAAWEGIKSGAAAVADFFVTTWTKIQNAVKTAWDFLTNLFFTYTPLGILISNWQPIVDFFAGIWLGVVNTVMGAFNAIAGWVMPWITWFQGVFAAAWGVIQFLVLLPIRLAQIAIEWAWAKITDAFWVAWTWVSGVFMASWNLVTGLVAAVVNTARDWITAAWQNITDRFWAAWTWVSGVFMAGWNLLTGWLSGPINTAKDWIGTIWNLITGAFSAAWNWVSGVFMSWWRTLTSLIGSVMDTVRGGIDTAWQWITRIFTDAWNWVTNVFRGWWNGLVDLMRGPIDMAKAAIDGILAGIRTAFEQAVNFIRDTWAKVKDAVAAPVKIAIEIGNKLIGGFRSVAEKVGLKIDMPDIPPLPAYRTGGRAPGQWSAANRDPYLGVIGNRPAFRFEGEEGIISRASMRKLDSRHPGAFEHINATGELPGFATGGRVWPAGTRTMSPNYAGHSGIDFPVPTGTPILAAADGTIEYTGTGRGYGVAIFQRFADGLAAVYGHLMRPIVAVGQAVQAGQQIGISDNTGRSSGPHLHFEIAPGGGFANASNRAATLNWLGGANVVATDGGGGSLFDAFGAIKDLVTKGLDGLKAIGDHPLGQIVKAIPKKIADGLVEKIKSAVSIFDNPGGTPPGGAEGTLKVPGPNVTRWTDLVTRALSITGIGGGPGDVAAWLRQIWSESKGDPNLVQSSAVYDVNVARGDPARGLVQVPGVTWADFGRDMGPFMPNVYDPLKNLIVGMRAASKQYRDWRRVIGYGHGYWRGTESARPGLAVVGEQGRELIDFGRGGARVFNNTDTEQILSGKSKEQTVIQIHGNVGWNPDEVAEQIEKRQRRARVRAGLIGVS